MGFEQMKRNNKNFNKEFLNYFQKMSMANYSAIEAIRFNKKSVSIKLNPDLKYFFFNEFMTRDDLLSIIIHYLGKFIMNHYPEYSYLNDIDYLESKFTKLNVL